MLKQECGNDPEMHLIKKFAVRANKTRSESATILEVKQGVRYESKVSGLFTISRKNLKVKSLCDNAQLNTSI